MISDQSSFLDLDFDEECFDLEEEEEEWCEERWDEDISVSVTEEEDSYWTVRF